MSTHTEAGEDVSLRRSGRRREEGLRHRAVRRLGLERTFIGARGVEGCWIAADGYGADVRDFVGGQLRAQGVACDEHGVGPAELPALERLVDSTKRVVKFAVTGR